MKTLKTYLILLIGLCRSFPSQITRATKRYPTWVFRPSDCKRQPSLWLSCVLSLTLTGWLQATQADLSLGYRYHYINLSNLTLPPGFGPIFRPTAIADDGRVYGNVFDAKQVSHIAVYADGALTVIQPGHAETINAIGTIGGTVTNPKTGKIQAVLFRGTQVELIPTLPGEETTRIVSLNDADTALLYSLIRDGPDYLTVYRLYQNGKTFLSYQVPSEINLQLCCINNAGIVAGTILMSPTTSSTSTFAAIRIKPPYTTSQVMDPFPTDGDTMVFKLNNTGNLLGRSFTLNTDNANHYGIWDQQGNFSSYYETSFRYDSLFNDSNLMVLTGKNELHLNNSFLLPAPGVRLDLMDLVDNPNEVEIDILIINGMNNLWDLIGYGGDSSGIANFQTFLLRKLPPVAANYDDKTGRLTIVTVKVGQRYYSAELQDQGNYQFKLVQAQPLQEPQQTDLPVYETDTGIVSIPAVFAFNQLYQLQLRNQNGLFVIEEVNVL